MGNLILFCCLIEKKKNNLTHQGEAPLRTHCVCEYFFLVLIIFFCGWLLGDLLGVILVHLLG